MNAQMKRKEPPGHAIERVCRWHLKKALAGLRKAGAPDAVHEVRKDIKKLRALLSLARRALGRKKLRVVTHDLRRAPKPLAASRDAQVIAAEFEVLVPRNARRFGMLRRHISAGANQATKASPGPKSVAEACHWLKRVRRHLRKLHLRRLEWADLRNGVEESHALGCAAYRTASRAPTSELLHQWRKQVRKLDGQLEFLSNRWPARTRKRLAALHELGDRLGEDHDLALLGKFLEDRVGPGPEIARLRQMVQTRRGQLQARIWRLGERVYSLSAAEVGEQVEADWKAWRKA